MNLKFRERELKNDLSEKREEDSKDFVKILEAKDINQLIQCLARIYYRSKQKRAIKNRLKDNKEHQNLNKTEIETLLKLEKIAKDLSLLSKHKENRYLLHDLAKNMVNDRKESSKELQEIENNKKLSKEFENLMEDFERNKGNPKRQDNILSSFEKIYTNQFQGDKNISKSFEKTHYEQFKKINEFFTKNIKDKDLTKTREKESLNKDFSMGRAM